MDRLVDYNNPHKGHRDRLREKYLRGGADSFNEHELVELLLFYCIPRRNTNEIAHRLLEEFGSLHNLMDSSPEVISERAGITVSSSVLLTLVPDIYKAYALSKWKGHIEIKSSGIAAEYAISLFLGETEECFYMICLNSCNVVLSAVLVSRGTVNESAIYTRSIVELALRHKTIRVILTHNHPSGRVDPSKNDIDATKRIISALSTVGISVADHIICSGEEYYSFAERKLLSLEY